MKPITGLWRKRFFFCSLVAFSHLSSADTIPLSLSNAIKGYQTQSIKLERGVLYAQFKRPVVTQTMFRSFVLSICTPLILSAKKDGWGGAMIERIETKNQIGAQGFAFVGGRKSCIDLGRIPGNATNNFIASKTWVCVAGNECRPRRQGEIIAGDE